MATRNTTWGYTRLRDAMNNVGYDIGRTTIQRILAEHGIEPAPERKREYSWATFIKAHLGAIAGMDFFTIEVLTMVGLVRYHVLFVIDIGTGSSRWWGWRATLSTITVSATTRVLPTCCSRDLHRRPTRTLRSFAASALAAC